jgi:hypothetical protein
MFEVLGALVETKNQTQPAQIRAFGVAYAYFLHWRFMQVGHQLVAEQQQQR